MRVVGRKVSTGASGSGWVSSTSTTRSWRRIEAVRKCDDRNAEIEGEVQAIAKDNGLAVSVVRDYWADVFPGSHWADDVPELHFLPTSEA